MTREEAIAALGLKPGTNLPSADFTIASQPSQVPASNMAGGDGSGMPIPGDQIVPEVGSTLIPAGRPGATPTLPRLPPATEAALTRASDMFRTAVPASYVSPSMRRMGAREGVFLNTDDGASLGTRFQLGLDPNQFNQFKMLTERYGAGNVDLSDEGKFVLRDQPVISGEGKYDIRNQPPGSAVSEDVLVNPVGLESGDVAEGSAQILPLAAGVVGAIGGTRARVPPGSFLRFGNTRLGRALDRFLQTGFGKVTGGSIGSGVAQEGVGGVQDAIVRQVRNDPINVTGIAKHRAVMATMDTIFGMAAAGLGKAASKAGEGVLGFFGIPIGQTSAEIAQQVLLRRTGVERPLTPGEASESAFLQRIESMMGARPGTSGTMTEMWAEQQAADDELRRVFLGLPRTMTDEQLATVLPHEDLVGQRVLSRLRQETTGLEQAATDARRDILITGTDEAERLAGVNLRNRLGVTTRTGEQAQTRAIREFDTFHSAAGREYTDFLSRPEIANREVSGAALSRDVGAVERRLTPDAEFTREVPTFDTYGNPTSRTQSSVERLDAFVPGKVQGYIDTLKRLSNAKISVNSLKQIRTEISNSIKEGQAIPGTDTTQLSALAKAVDDNITAALQGMPDPVHLATWNDIRTRYAANSARFNRPYIKDLLVPPGEIGSLGATKIAGRIQGNSDEALDAYNAYREFFGATSTEFRELQHAARQDILGNSFSDVTPYIRGKKLRDNLNNTRAEVLEDLFGTTRQDLAQIGAILERAEGVALGTEELHALASSRTLTASRVQALVDAEAAATEAHANQLLHAASQGTLRAEQMDPAKVVKTLTSMNPTDARQVMGALGDQPALIDEVRQLAIEDIWGQIQAGAYSQKKISPELLNKALGNPTQQETWRTILGTDTLEGLRSLLRATESSSTIAKGFGGSSMAAANDMTQIAFHGEVGAIEALAKRFLLATLYKGPLRRSITNMMKSQDRGRFLSGVIAGAPFIRAVHERFGTDMGQGIMEIYRDLVEPMQQRELTIQGEIDGDVNQLSEAERRQRAINLLHQ